MSKIPPMLRQYREIKNRYPDAIVLFRLGDFYEMFDADAELGARELQLVLTKRRFSKTITLPMCGVPHQRITTYIAQLIERGHKVALVEQLEDARKTNKLVKRDVVRVITPGTVVEDALLRETTENYLVAIAVETSGKTAPRYGLSIIDLSTGEFAATEAASPEMLCEELSRLRPREYVLSPDLAEDTDFTLKLLDIHAARFSPVDARHFDHDNARDCLRTHFRVASLEAYGCDSMPLATSVAGAALAYLQENQISDLAHLTGLRTYSLTEYMILDGITRRNLELAHRLRDGAKKGTLISVLDCTKNAMGARLLRRWMHQPLCDVTRIQARLDAVEELHDDAFLRADVRELLDGLHDVERLVGRVGFGNANGRDLVALRQALLRLPQLKRVLDKAQAARLRTLNEKLDELRDVERLIGNAIVEEPPILIKDGGLIKDGYDAELDRLRGIATAGRDWLVEFEARERKRTKIPNLRVKYNQVFGFFIEVTKSHLHKVPPEYDRRATITHAERFICPELKRRETEILSAEDRINELEYELFTRVRAAVATHAARLSRAARIMAELDTLAALAETAARRGYVKPEVHESIETEIRAGRHPFVECNLADGERFVPNDTILNAEDDHVLIITGPNMAGKSVYIRQVALITLLAQMGSFVPADAARIGIVDRIFTRVGATDDVAQGRSTFLVEMSETSYILRHATPRSLIILDEVGRGTSTYDGMSLAWAVVEELHDTVRARTLFATHFHELTALAERLRGVCNYTLAVEERGHEVIFLRQLVAGGADKSYGIHVAQLAGMPERVVARAREMLKRLENSAEADEPQEEEKVIREERAVWEVDTGLLVPKDESAAQEVLREIYRVDIGNLTPVRALVLLNELQGKLRGAGNE